MEHGLNTDMKKKNLTSMFGGPPGVGQEIIKIVETNKLVRWKSFNPQTREYEIQFPDGTIKILHEGKITKEFSSQEESDFRRSEKNPN